MPKFGLPDEEPVAPKPAMDQIPAATKGAAAAIPTTFIDNSSRIAYSTPAPQVKQLSVAAQLA